jgi:hypothetical protein
MRFLQCHDPPLEDEDIPEGDWICIKCFTSKPELANRVTAAATRTSVTSDMTPDTRKKSQVCRLSINQSIYAYQRDSKERDTLKASNLWFSKKNLFSLFWKLKHLYNGCTSATGNIISVQYSRPCRHWIIMLEFDNG